MERLEEISLAIEYLIRNIKARFNTRGRFEKDTWLISEMGFDAQDNGYELYKYILFHKELGITPVYVISEGDDDYKKVKRLGGRTVEIDSDEHLELMYTCGALVSTYAYGYTPNKDIYYKLAKFFLFRPRGKNVFLQHGICDKEMSELHRINYRPDMFTISTSMEHEAMWEKHVQPENVIKNVGLCRYDDLFDKEPRKQILIMPTWRTWLEDTDKYEFAQSNFFQYWNSLLMNGNLLYKLKNEGYEVVFYCHPKFQQYANMFANFGIKIETDGIHGILKNSQLLVTDYSSVYFDMVYMGRNVIFWQFDDKRYHSEHYGKAFVDYDKFGRVINDRVEDLSEAILESLKGRKFGDQEYIESFFMHHDNNNCKRTIEAIRGLD